MTLYIIPLHPYFTFSTFMLHEGAREKRSGATNRGTQRESECTKDSFSCNIRGKKSTQAAFTTGCSCREPSLFDQDNLFSLPALQYLAYHFIICPLAKLFHFWSTWWDSSYSLLIWEIREMGVKMQQNGENVSLFPSPLLTVRWSRLELKDRRRKEIIMSGINGLKFLTSANKWLTSEAFTVVWYITICKTVFYWHLSHEGIWMPRGSNSNTLIGFLEKKK